MARTLNGTLATAQNSQSRKPLCQLIVGKDVDEIPFVDNPGMSPDSYKQRSPSSVFLSDGRLAVFYVGKGSYRDYEDVRVVFSNASRTEFDPYIKVDDNTYQDMDSLQAIVMDSATDKMCVVARNTYMSSKIIVLTVSSAGAKLSDVEAVSYSSGVIKSGITIVKRADNDFMLVYVKSDNTVCYKTTTNCTSFSAEGTLTIPGLTAGRAISEPRIIKLANGTFIMTFTYQSYVDSTGSIYNIWYTTSSDCITWADAAPVTSTTLKSRDYSYSDIVQRSDDSLFVSLVESNAYLSMNSSTTGWTGRELTPSDMWLESANGKLYITSTHDNVGWKLQGTMVIDIATWTVDKSFNYTSVPVVPLYFRNGSMLYRPNMGAGQYSVVVGGSGILVMDFVNDNFRAFFFKDESGTYGEDCAKNVNWTPYVGNWSGYQPTIDKAWVDIENNRLYVYLKKGHLYDSNLQFGYIDLSQSGPTYNYTNLVSLLVESGNAGWDEWMRVYPGSNLLMMGGASGDWGGRLLIVHTSVNAIYKYYKRSLYADFPIAGVIDAVMIDKKVFATVLYQSSPTTEVYKYWILEIDLTTNFMKYHYPPFTAEKRFSGNTQSCGYKFGRIYLSEATDELIIDGFANPVVFNYVACTWEYINYNAEGAGPGSTNWWEYLIYDPVSQNYFGTKVDNSLYLLPRSGIATRVSYTTGIPGDFIEPEVLVEGYNNTQCQIADSPSDEIWAFWNDSDASNSNIAWGKTGAQIELSQYLTGETSVEWSMDGTPAVLQFTLSHGYLFDPQNPTSILNYYLEKGNMATLKFGDEVGGTEYYENQGKYVVREIRLHYKKGEYPVAQVKCEDIRCLWAQHQLTAVQLISSYPDDGIAEIVKENTIFTDDDLNIPSMTGRFTFDAQWMDAYLADIVNDIAGRFKYFLIVDMDGKLTARLIDTAKAVDHTYSDNSRLIDFTPDDTFSDLTNRVTVSGQSLDDIEVMYSEERIGDLAGTIGWWGFNKNRIVCYSGDLSKRAKFVRLKVIESSTTIMFDLAGDVTERISFVDPYHKYCIVTITAPNLIPVLIAGLAVWVAAHFIPDEVIVGGVGASAGITIPIGRIIESISLMVVMNVLGSVANYQYEIWGKPLGYVKRDYQATANDLVLQAKLGMVVEQKLEGFLCFTQDQCQSVADFELLLSQLQRNRASYSKTAHLQDEVGDKLSVKHPYTNAAISLLITKLRRKFKPASTSMANDGYFTDEMEGWVV